MQLPIKTVEVGDATEIVTVVIVVVDVMVVVLAKPNNWATACTICAAKIRFCGVGASMEWKVSSLNELRKKPIPP